MARLCESCDSETCLECFDSLDVEGCSEYRPKHREYIIKEIELSKEPGKCQERDNVNHPIHYNMSKIETIDKIEDSLSAEEFMGFCIGTTMKYLDRYKYKNGLEDLNKALWYLNKAIKSIGGV